MTLYRKTVATPSQTATAEPIIIEVVEVDGNFVTVFNDFGDIGPTVIDHRWNRDEAIERAVDMCRWHVDRIIERAKRARALFDGDHNGAAR